jgi:hypothetical protein
MGGLYFPGSTLLTTDANLNQASFSQEAKTLEYSGNG